MKFLSRGVLAGFLLLVMVQPALAQEPRHPEEELSIRDLDGVVTDLVVSRDEGGEEWLEAVVEPKTGGSLVFRLAPAEVMAKVGFVLEVGHRVRLRFFADEESPALVQRIRNQNTGRVLRLRCLHGQPLWRWGGTKDDRGPYGSPRDGRGGQGGGSGGG